MSLLPGQNGSGPSLREAELLVRSLVGVAAVQVHVGPDGRFMLAVTPDGTTSDRQLGRNVLSALKARFGLDLEPAMITITAPPADTSRTHGHAGATSAPASPRPVSADRAGPGPSTNGSGSVRPDAVGPRTYGSTNGTNGAAANGGHARNGNASHDEPPRATPHTPGTSVASHALGERPGAFPRARFQSAEFQRTPDSHRCRVVIWNDNTRFIGIADAQGRTVADIELAARATLDALRAAAPTHGPVRFEGIGITDVAGQAHIVVSLSLWAGHDFETIAGADPIRASAAEAAARAVLGAVNARVTD